jgi:hypothetical protein
MMAGDDGILTGFQSVWPYCEARIRSAEVKMIRPNQNYKCIYRAFIIWFDEKRHHFAIVDDGDPPIGQPRPLEVFTGTEGNIYITQYNVEMWYSTHLAQVATTGKATIRKKVSALNWFLEHIENPGTTTPLVYSATIKRSMDTQYANYLVRSTRANAGTDPHKGLKDLYSDKEAIKLVTGIWKLRVDSPDLMFSYSWGRNAGVRGASSRQVVLSDLNLSVAFGPEVDEPRNKTLLLVMRKGPLKNKDNHLTDKQVGVQRHVNYVMCTVFATAVCVVLRLRSLAWRVNFKRGDPDLCSEWWDISLTQYVSCSEESSAMRSALVSAGLLEKLAKVTHHRTMAVQYAGSRGLQPYQINTMTKHMLEKMHSAYAPEVEEETLKVMSGFRKHEHRFVPTEHVKFPGDQDLYLQEGIDHLLPEYRRYLYEYNSVEGDKTTCCEKFLLHIVPYFCLTILQCGYWFIRDFPEHPLTQLLRVSIYCYVDIR